MEHDTRPGPDRIEHPQSATTRAKQSFTLRMTLSGAEESFDDPRKAGAAFFAADPAERPTVIHVDGNAARTMARTELHGTHETGAPRYFKSLPESHGVDGTFRAGFLDEMQTSLKDRLGKVEWETEGQGREVALDARLRDDLDAFARRESEKAATLWRAHTDDVPPGPVLRSAVEARDEDVPHVATPERRAPETRPSIIAAGDWVTTDEDVDLRPVAAATERGIRTGYEAILPEGETTLTLSEQTFPDARAALRHAFDFYEGGEEGLDRAITHEAERTREMEDAPGPVATDFENHLDMGLDLAPQAGDRRERPEFVENPARAIAAWVDDSSTRIDRLPEAARGDLRREMNGIAAAAVSAFGLDRERVAAAAEVRVDSAAPEPFRQPGPEKPREAHGRVETDIARIAERHRVEAGDERERGRAADLVDAISARAATFVQPARVAGPARETDPLIDALGAMATLHARQGTVAFRSEDQARDFAEDMKARYGERVLHDMAEGRTDALAKEVPDPAARQSMAEAVVAAAKEHPALGLSASEIESAERRQSAVAHDRDPGRNRAPVHAHDREL